MRPINRQSNAGIGSSNTAHGGGMGLIYMLEMSPMKGANDVDRVVGVLVK